MMRACSNSHGVSCNLVLAMVQFSTALLCQKTVWLLRPVYSNIGACIKQHGDYLTMQGRQDWPFVYMSEIQAVSTGCFVSKANNNRLVNKFGEESKAGLVAPCEKHQQHHSESSEVESPRERKRGRSRNSWRRDADVELQLIRYN